MSQYEHARITRSLCWIAGAGLGLAACGAAPDDRAPPPPGRFETACVGGYTLTDLTALGGSQVGYAPYGISPGGAVTGAARPASDFSPLQVFSWTAATGLSALGSLGGDPAQGNAINDAQQIAGTSYLSGDVDQHAFFYDPATGFHDLGSFGGTGFDASAALGINVSGTVVGFAKSPDGHHHAFSWSGGALNDLGLSPTGFNSEAYAINDAGVAVGRADGFDDFDHAAMFSGGTVTDLGALGGTSQALAINSAGIAVGQASDGGGWLPVIFNGDGTVTQIPLVDSYDKAVAHGISDSGQIVGELWPASDSGLTRHHAFVSQAGDSFDLNDLVSDHSIELTSALAINAAGQIVGQGLGASDGTFHAYLLTPVSCSEPRGFVALETAVNAPIPVPAGVSAGDLLVAAFEVDADPSSLTAPIGWTLVLDQAAGSGDSAFHAVVYTHVATTTEPDSYSFDAPDGVWVGGQIAAYHGVSAVEASASAAATGTGISAPSVTAANTSDVLVALYVDFDGGTWSTASGLTSRSNFEGNSLQDAIIAASGPTGAWSATDTTSSALAAITLALH